MSTPVLRDFVPVGGHDDLFCASPSSPSGLWEPAWIAKMVRPREAAFYLAVMEAQERTTAVEADGEGRPVDAFLRSILNLTETDVSSLRRISGFIPQCFAISQNAPAPLSGGDARRGGSPADFGSSSWLTVTMENICADLQWPCVLDLKIGTEYSTYYTDPTKAADLARRAAICTTSTLGVRHVGLKGRQYASGDEVEVKREVGRQIATAEALTAEIVKFVELIREDLRQRLCEDLLSQLRQIKEWFTEQKTFVFRQSSLLLVFDSFPPSSQQQALKADERIGVVKLVDFSHIVGNDSERTIPTGIDQGFLFGLRNTITIFENILKEGQIGRNAFVQQIPDLNPIPSAAS